ncbi:hypothetical protein FWF48_02675 [Candidatus Saccharibacteria bacterium]|nr:hypothetical protein [Candidatus Saccharibacteria bacterium]
MFIAILGRQPKLGLAELEQVFGSSNITLLTPDIAQITGSDLNITRLGGTKKAGKIIAKNNSFNTNFIEKTALNHIANLSGKITLGLSAYNIRLTAKDLQEIGLQIKNRLKKQGQSLRLVPQNTPELNTATSHHNKLGLNPNKIELLIVQSTTGELVIATSTGAQNITAYAQRDQNRPARDAYIGMLPPKLAQIMINLATRESQSVTSGESELRRVFSDDTRNGGLAERPKATLCDSRVSFRILDPFCGTGVLLQEALLMGFTAYGSDISPKMVEYTTKNLEWLTSRRRGYNWQIELGDATNYTWQAPISAVASEIYLGHPLSKAPASAKLNALKQECRSILVDFLTNLAPQITTGTPLCLAIPAWQIAPGKFERLDILDSLAQLGYNLTELKHVKQSDLIYYRKDQIVGRQLLVLTRS